MQTAIVTLTFYRTNNIETFLSTVNMKMIRLFPSVKDLNLDRSLTLFLEEQRSNILKKRLGEPKQTSLVGKLFSWFIFVCFAAFIVSLINALDKQYRERKTREARRTE